MQSKLLFNYQTTIKRVSLRTTTSVRLEQTLRINFSDAKSYFSEVF